MRLGSLTSTPEHHGGASRTSFLELSPSDNRTSTGATLCCTLAFLTRARLKEGGLETTLALVHPDDMLGGLAHGKGVSADRRCFSKRY